MEIPRKPEHLFLNYWPNLNLQFLKNLITTLLVAAKLAVPSRLCDSTNPSIASWHNKFCNVYIMEKIWTDGWMEMITCKLIQKELAANLSNFEARSFFMISYMEENEITPEHLFPSRYFTP